MAVQIPFATVSQIRQIEVVEDIFFTGLLEQCQIDNNEPEWLQDIRKAARDNLSHLSVPTRKDEDWRFIDLADLTASKFLKSTGTSGETFLDQKPLEEAKQSSIAFINGNYVRDLVDVTGLPSGVYVGNLANLPEKFDASKYFAQCHGAQDAFTSLNTAGGEDIAVVWIEKNVAVETPIELLFLSFSESQTGFIQPRVLVVAETGSSVSIIEKYTGKGDYFTNAVSEVYVGENAKVNHTRLQEESDSSYHIGKTAVSQSRDSHYTINEINLGAQLFRHNPEVLQKGEQTTTNLNGLTVATEKQISDTHSIIALTKPYGTTDQLHKCIVSDRAHTVFNGKVFVPKAAQLTDATQLNRNLMLSSKARVDTKPELQITADNVKCAHGATVSQLEADEIFYLRSRGLTQADANQLLIDAFAAEIVDRLSVESLRDQITQTIKQKIQ